MFRDGVIGSEQSLFDLLRKFIHVYSRFAGIITGSSCAFTIVRYRYCLYNLIVHGTFTFYGDCPGQVVQCRNAGLYVFVLM